MFSTHISLYARIVDNLVNVICRHAGPGSGRSNIEDFSCQSADFAHARNALFVEHLDVVLADIRVSRYAIF